MADLEKQPDPFQLGESRVSAETSESNSNKLDASINTLTDEHSPQQPQDNLKDPSPPKIPSSSPTDIPNGGWQAWMQVVGGFFILFNTWGILNCFGVFQTYYESGQLFQESSSNISWIGSIQSYCLLLGGLFSGPIYDRGYLRSLLLTGAFGIIFGHMMLSLCTTYWQVLLAQGFCVGLGAGCLFVPAMALLPTYFSTKIGLTVGLVASGSSFGGVIYPLAFYRLIQEVGFGWSVRILGFIALATLIIPVVFLRMRFKPARVRAIIDWTAFTDWQFMTFVVGAIIGFIGLYVMIFYISYFGEVTGITSPSISFYLVPILNATSMFGRTLPNALADRTGPLNIIAPGAFCCSILLFCMMAVKSAAALIVMAALFGFFSGVFVALPAVCFVSLTKNKALLGTRIGMGFAMIGFGVLAGGPGGGSILQKDPSRLNWTGIWVYGGVADCVCGVIFVMLRFWRTGPKIKARC